LLRINYGLIIGPTKENNEFVPAHFCMAKKVRRNPSLRLQIEG